MITWVSFKVVTSIHLVVQLIQVSIYLTGDKCTPLYIMVGDSKQMMLVFTVSNLPKGRENDIVSFLYVWRSCIVGIVGNF